MLGGTRQFVSDEELRARACEWAERTAVEQGLPPRVEDVAVLRRVLYLMGFVDLDGLACEAALVTRTLAQASAVASGVFD